MAEKFQNQFYHFIDWIRWILSNWFIIITIIIIIIIINYYVAGYSETETETETMTAKYDNCFRSIISPPVPFTEIHADNLTSTMKTLWVLKLFWIRPTIFAV